MSAVASLNDGFRSTSETDRDPLLSLELHMSISAFAAVAVNQVAEVPAQQLPLSQKWLAATGVVPSATRPDVIELTKLTIQSTITSSLNESSTRLPAHSTK